VLTKPCDPATLISEIRRLTSGNRAALPEHWVSTSRHECADRPAQI